MQEISIPYFKKVRLSPNKDFSVPISNVYKYLQEIKEEFTINGRPDLVLKYELSNVAGKVASIFKTSKSWVQKILKTEAEQENHAPHLNVVRAKAVIRDRVKFVCDSYTIGLIRRVFFRFSDLKMYPTILKMYEKCLEDPLFPKVSRFTFHRWLLTKCKFKYKKVNKKPVLIDRPDIRQQRRRYLTECKALRDEGYKFFYQDETWANPDQRRPRTWQVFLNDVERRQFADVINQNILEDMDGYAGGFMVKGGAGRVIINHIGSDNGFLDGALDVFISRKDASDYHNTMNAEHFNAWFKKVLELLPNKSAIVIDLAPYHRKKIPGSGMPTTAWRKQEIINWLLQHNFAVPSPHTAFCQMTKNSLLLLSKQKQVPSKYVIEQFAEDSGKDVKIVWLPPAHCEFNAIELVWAYIKNDVATHNTGGSVQNILQLTNQAISKVTPALWERCISHARKYEERICERDNIKFWTEDNTNFQFLIPLQDKDTTTEDETDSSESDSESEDELEVN